MNNVLAGDVLIDNIEIIAAIPATPRVDFTFDDTSDSEGFIGANGVTLSQPVAGELRLDIADQSPYPKLEQSGLYSVDADTYKYIQVTLINNPSTKNKLTFVSPSGGNQYSTSDMVMNSADPQTIEIDLSSLTNWSGTQSSWWFQLVDNSGDGAVASAADMHIQQILFLEESSQPTGVTAPWTDDFEDADITDWTILTAADASQGWVLANGTNGSLVMYHADDNVSSGVDNYLASPVIDMSGLTSPILSYSERGSYPTYYTFHGVYTSDDYTGDVAAATWTLLTEGVAPTTEAVQEFSIPNTTTGIAFRYQGDYSDTWEIDNVSVTDAPTEPAMEVAVSTNIDSATFSFTVENFTVGASGDAGVDGHIHYSLNGGSTVMVYSSDDLTLSDLPDGDHTIVFELVDEAHASLDPAVTQSVNFSTNNACGDTVTYTQVANGDYTVGASAAAGEVASVTVDADMETNYDYLYVRDGAGNLLNSDNTTGLIQATYESPDGVITVNVTNDGSVQGPDVTHLLVLLHNLMLHLV